MIDKAPYEASYPISRAGIKLTAAAVFFTLLIAGYLSQGAAQAATSGQSVQEAPPLSERPPVQSIHAVHQTLNAQPAQNIPAGPVMTLSEVEGIATQNNPTLAQAEAAIRFTSMATSSTLRALRAGASSNPRGSPAIRCWSGWLRHATSSSTLSIQVTGCCTVTCRTT